MNKVILTALVSLFTVSSFAQFRISHNDDSPLRKLQYAEIAITNLYVDSVDEKKLVEDAIRGMLNKLDPHSSYSTPKEVKELNEPLNGNFEGIGVQFNMIEDTLLVIQPVTNGPSEKVGILAGDRIVSVNDTAIAGVKMSKEEIMKRLRGPKGSYSTNPGHMPDSHRDFVEWDGNRFRRWAGEIGPSCEAVVDGILKSRKIEQQSYRSCRGVLALAKKHGKEMLEQACAKALSYSPRPSYKTVKSIASKMAESVPEDPDDGAYLRGSGYYQNLDQEDAEGVWCQAADPLE